MLDWTLELRFELANDSIRLGSIWSLVRTPVDPDWSST